MGAGEPALPAELRSHWPPLAPAARRPAPCRTGWAGGCLRGPRRRPFVQPAGSRASAATGRPIALVSPQSTGAAGPPGRAARPRSRALAPHLTLQALPAGHGPPRSCDHDPGGAGGEQRRAGGDAVTSSLELAQLQHPAGPRPGPSLRPHRPLPRQPPPAGEQLPAQPARPAADLIGDAGAERPAGARNLQQHRSDPDELQPRRSARGHPLSDQPRTRRSTASRR